MKLILRRLLACVMAVMFCMAAFSIPVHAEGGDYYEYELPPNENPDVLYPQGNMTIVSDISGEAANEKEFITVVSKNGNYFYIIIDRDDEGENTVHFLNQVDEADLLNLMDEEDAQAILDADAKEAAERAAREQAAREAEEAASRPQTEQVQEEKKPVNWIPAAICVMLAGIGVVVFFLIRMKKKTDPAEQFPDPDANYSEDEDGYDLQEEADEDNSEESEEE